MIRKYFKVTLLANIVVNESSATEGKHRSLSYIPGGKFLGIASQLYEETKEGQTLDIFHNGEVRFGDAHPYIENERLLKAPLSWAFPKGDSWGQKVYATHEMTQDDYQGLLDDGIQPKQVRDKFFSWKEQNTMRPTQRFSLKSKYDLETKRSEDEAMYGYHGLPVGSTWSFYVDFETDKHVNIVLETLANNDETPKNHHLGRSRKSEFGKISIELIKEIPNEMPQSAAPTNGYHYLYASSNLCFLDEHGQTSSTPTIDDLTIDWEKSKIRTRLYRTYNGHRNNHNPDRTIIEKGSVIAIKSDKNLQVDRFQNGIGAFRSEGFGEVLLNPEFLIKKIEFQFSKVDETTGYYAPVINDNVSDALILKILGERQSNVTNTDTVSTKIQDFIKDYNKDFKHISNSQWGQIRKIGKLSSNAETLETLLFEEKIGFCNKGQSAKHWAKNSCIITLRQFINGFKSYEESKEGLTKLSTEMTKQIKENQPTQA